ncbi:WecB/TagA/CpsF family glycosyltransferase [Patescibacteria group bacterium]|nr:WecB/TagA/CpsF family glycosyltransferase [Patescibacteria group bacterium]
MKVNILGINVDGLTEEQALEKIDSFLQQEKQHFIITANSEFLLKCWADQKLTEIVNQADLVTADGIGLLWAAKFLKKPLKSFLWSLWQAYFTAILLMFKRKNYHSIIPQRITGIDLMEKMCKLAAANNQSLYLLGADRGVAEKTAEILQKNYPDLKIAGTDQGPPNLNKATAEELTEMTDKIKMVNPDILLVAFGQPKQELWINQNLEKLPSVKVAMGVGGAFDFIGGKAKRAPALYQELGLEWLWRFLHEPQRAVRIFNATFKFMYTVVKLKHRFN